MILRNMRWFGRKARDLLGSRRGNFALPLALVSPLLLVAVAGGTDLVVMENHRGNLQNAADAAVLAVAKEAGLKGWKADAAEEVASSNIAVNLANRFSSATFAHKLTTDEKTREISLELTQDHYAYFTSYFIGSPQITVHAKAHATGQSSICIIVQSPSQNEAFFLGGASRISASGCSAYSNSTSTKGISVKDTSTLVSQLACSAGGFNGKPGNFSPLPITDCPTIADPLASRAQLVDNHLGAPACDFQQLKLRQVSQTLRPGTYCGGIDIKQQSQITLQPGIYIIKDGKLKIDQGSSIKGDKVAFVFMGAGATLDFKNDSKVSLSAPESGPMAGILIYAQPTSKPLRDFKLESKDAEKLIGTVYLPSDKLVIGGDKDGDGVCDPDIADDGTIVPSSSSVCDSDVGAASSWTAIVAKELKVTAGSNLVLNSDYQDSLVPVPDGIGPNSGRVLLSR